MRIEAGIYTRAMESRNILEKQYIRKRERSNDTHPHPHPPFNF
jgi:hypothetical protein